jgi:hypothetical protein
MELLAQTNATDTVRESMRVVNIGLGAFAGAIILFGLLILWINRERFRGLNGMLSLAVLLIGLPLGMRLAVEKTNLYPLAVSRALIKDINITSPDTETRKVEIVLSGPAVAVLEFTPTNSKQTFSVIPDSGLENQSAHVFIIKNFSPGEAIFVINGIKILPSGSSLKLQ